MSEAVFSPNLTKKFQWEVSQIANNNNNTLKPPKTLLHLIMIRRNLELFRK